MLTSELLERLTNQAGDDLPKGKTWPKNAQALSGLLRRLAPNLRAAGVDVAFERETTGKKRRLVVLRPVVPESVTRVTASPSPLPRPNETGDETGDERAAGDAPAGVGDVGVTRAAERLVTAESPVGTRPRDPSPPAGDAGDAAVRAPSEAAGGNGSGDADLVWR